MTTLNKIIAASAVAVMLLAGGAFAASQALPGLLNTSEKFAANATKACHFPAGGWTIVDCSNVAAAASAELNDWSRYVVQCGVNSRVAFGTSSVVADSGDGYLPAGSWLEFMTSGSVRYVSCLNIGSDDDCRIMECQ